MGVPVPRQSVFKAEIQAKVLQRRTDLTSVGRRRDDETSDGQLHH